MSVRISYFDARGFTESTRWILSYGGVDFEDIRVPMDGFPHVPVAVPSEIKQKTRWGFLPLAEFEGRKLNQSLAIARYFARKFGLVPDDDFEAALCDEYVDSVVDYMKAWFAVEVEKDSDKQKQKLEEVIKTTNPKFLNVFERIVKENGGKHLVGNSLTWADIYLTQAVNHAEVGFGINILSEYPAIKGLSENVMGIPKIKAWIEKRPQCKF